MMKRPMEKIVLIAAACLAVAILLFGDPPQTNAARTWEPTDQFKTQKERLDEELFYDGRTEAGNISHATGTEVDVDDLKVRGYWDVRNSDSTPAAPEPGYTRFFTYYDGGQQWMKITSTSLVFSAIISATSTASDCRENWRVQLGFPTGLLPKVFMDADGIFYLPEQEYS